MSDVSLVVMPFASVHRPSIGVSLLKSGLEEIGVSSKIYYFNIDFAASIGLENYNPITSRATSLLGEWIFANIAFDRDLINTKVIRKYLNTNREFLDDEDYTAEENFTNTVLQMEKSVKSFINECTTKILNENPKIIGFTSMFQQQCSCIALANAIKGKSDIPIIFGGANCEGEMGYELIRNIPSIDFVCSGEGDIAFIAFIKYLLADQQIPKINGIVTRNSDRLDVALTSPVMDMNDLPFPDYHDYFVKLNESPLKDTIKPHLVIETARGCWWGEVSQCTFCGLNGSTMKYRSKSIERAINEIEYLKNTNGLTTFFVVDNILNLDYITQLFPYITKRKLNTKLFYETKSNLKRNQIQIMKEGGIYGLQPGIESLSDAILDIMKKGVTALQNIQTLKWCRELEIRVEWNFLYGFPGEPIAEYNRMTEIIPLLTHLEPPNGCDRITIHRYSPYFVEPLKYGIIDVKHVSAYDCVYPFQEKSLQKLAYYFDFNYADNRNLSYIIPVRREVKNWQKLWTNEQKPFLNMLLMDDMIIIQDSRPCSIQEFYSLKNETMEVYRICGNMHSIDTILIKIKDKYPLITESDVTNVINYLVSKKLLLSNKGMYLSLAVELDKL